MFERLLEFVDQIKDLYGDAVGDFAREISNATKRIYEQLKRAISRGQSKNKEIDRLNKELKRLNDLLKERDDLIDRILKDLQSSRLNTDHNDFTTKSDEERLDN